MAARWTTDPVEFRQGTLIGKKVVSELRDEARRITSWPSRPRWLLSSTAPLFQDGLDFQDGETLARYRRLTRALRVYFTLSFVLLIPSLALFAISYLSSSSPAYVYLAPAAVGGAFSFLSARTASGISEIINSDHVHHVT
jgi:hypothetical protein